MVAVLLLLCSAALWAQGVVLQAPAYTADSVVNAADNRPDYFAPNTIISIYGTNLSHNTVAVGQSDLRGGSLPYALGGVRVRIAGIFGHLLYVSPGQINVLIPANLVKGTVELRIDRDGVAGPGVNIRLEDTAAAAFQLDRETIIATHADGSLLTTESPAQPGEVIVIYATGLGRTIPRQSAGDLARTAATSEFASRLRVELDGATLPPESVYYAGVTPGFAGLYQINLQLPPDLNGNPRIRFHIDDRSSAEGLIFPTSAGSAAR